MEEKKEIEVKPQKRHPILILLLIILVFAAGIAGGFLGVKYAQKEQKKEDAKPAKTEVKEEKVPDQNEIVVLKTSDKLVEKAYSYINLGYEGLPILNELYSGRNIILTELSDELKFAWTLNLINRDILIPMCDPEQSINIPDSKIQDYSPFEKVNFINSVKKENPESIGTFNYSYDTDHFILTNSNCDGYGPGPAPIIKTEVKNASKKGEILTINVKFAYFVNDGFNEDANEFTYTMYETLSEKGKVLQKNVSSEEDLSKIYAEYQLTFKVVSDNIYPLSVKKV